MSYIGNEEELIELPTIEYLQKNLGYEFINGEKLSPELGERSSYGEVILNKRLEKALYRLNSWMNESDVSKAIEYLKCKEQKEEALININNKIHNTLVDSNFTIEKVDNKDESKQQRVSFIDWENTNNNDFLVTSQFKVKGINEDIIADIVIFINGIPVVVLECKSGLIENKNDLKQQAYEKLNQYINRSKVTGKERVEQLFYTNFFTGVLTENNNYIGTISPLDSQYLHWNDCYPFAKQELDDIEKHPNNLALQGVFHKENILNIMSNFIVFENDNHSIAKRMCRYYQYRAVDKAVMELMNYPKAQNSCGFIHQTHGSGRYMTMVYLINKIKKIDNLANNMIVIVTDRVDSSRQLYDVFIRMGINLPIKCVVTSNELKDILIQGKSEIVITTIQKFQDEEGIILNENRNVIVLVDNAHRTQRGRVALKMRQSLPNATYIGFSQVINKNVQQMFGNCIDKYSMKNATEDGFAIKILYDQRLRKYQIDTLELKYTNDDGEVLLEDDDRKNLLEDDNRIDEIAKDILSHYKDNVYPGGFKAQVVCSSRRACIKYYEALNKYMTEVIGEPLEIGVITSSNVNDSPAMNRYSLNKQEQHDVIRRFKEPLSNNKLAFLVVTDMLLTDFDAPIQQAIYICKNLTGNKLAQSTIRVSRPYEDKQCAYIVDYYGISDCISEIIDNN
ncbi:MAG: type I restriction endonuclease subunit R [Clostridium sp.]|uniref:type I restriction endonuclease subunit R n=1 Tax=Clostridium sp. TaxID=1506 RepID=UPI003D6CE7BA